MSRAVTDRLLVPIANEDDAQRTCESIRAYFDDETGPLPTIVAVHVIEKGGGAIDKAPMDLRKEQAEVVFKIVERVLDPAGFDVETDLLFGTDLVETIVDAVDETDATAIAFLPREGGFLVRFLSGNLARDLVMESPVPVITFPTEDAVS